MPAWGKGKPKTGGRKRGTPNKATLIGKELCVKLVSDPIYVASLQKRLQAGKLPPGVEVMLWDRAFGKVKDVVQHEGSSFAPLEIILTDATATAPDAEPSLS